LFTPRAWWLDRDDGEVRVPDGGLVSAGLSRLLPPEGEASEAGEADALQARLTAIRAELKALGFSSRGERAVLLRARAKRLMHRLLLLERGT
jgi:hypothetical protein